MRGERTLLSLTALGASAEIVEEQPGFPVQARTITPLPNSRIDAGTLPALEMRPPCEVRIDVPPTERGAELSFAVGIDATSFRGSGSVRFEVVLDGEPVFDETLSCSADLGREQRAWRRASLPMAEGGELVLRTSARGELPEPPLCGFGLLRLEAPYEVRRTRASPRRPNVVLVLIDTLRADRLHCLGNPREITPALDALAARGTLFERAFSTSSWTWPSTASLLTSLHPTEHGLQDATSCSLAEEHLTLPERLLAEGFVTAAFTSNNLISDSKGFAQGFETFELYPWVTAAEVLPDVEAWLDEMHPWRFFLYLHVVDPHFPYEGEPDLVERFVPAPPEGYGVKGVVGAELTGLRQGLPHDAGLLEDHMRHALATYDAEVATVDRSVARLLQKLDELGLTDSTIVAVTSDHGEEFLEHDMLAHGHQLYDETVHVPLLIAGPGVPVGRRVSAAAENRFLAPTLLELTRVEPEGNLRGPSLLAELPAGEPVFFTTGIGKWLEEPARGLLQVGDIFGVEVDGWRFFWAPRGVGDADDLVRLHNVARDPRMMRDVSAEHPREVGRLRAMIAAWEAEGAAVRPSLLAGDRETVSELRALGYLGDE